MIEHVVVSGGGIAGSAAALALRTAGIGVTVLETRPADDDSGAVVRLNPNGMDALRAVGAHQAVIARSFPLVRSERVTPDGARVAYTLAADPASERGLPRVLHWAVLARVLREEAARRGAVFRHGSPVKAVERRDDGATAVLENGDRVDGDVLVGADGVHSTVRGALLPDGPAPRRLGTRTLYGYASEPGCEPPPPEVLRAYLGPKGFFAATRDSTTGGCFWFTSLRAAEEPQRDPEVLRAALLDVFDGGGDLAATVVRQSERILSFDDHALESLPRWQDGRMVVVGDAAHVAPPASEQGAGMAVEDGVQLARCLRDHADAPAALAAFERLRRERAEAVVAAGVGSTSRVHRGGMAKRLRELRSRATALLDWQRRPPTGGGWAYDHHIDWAERADG